MWKLTLQKAGYILSSANGIFTVCCCRTEPGQQAPVGTYIAFTGEKPLVSTGDSFPVAQTDSDSEFAACSRSVCFAKDGVNTAQVSVHRI